MVEKLGILLIDDERIFGATVKTLLVYKAKFKFEFDHAVTLNAGLEKLDNGFFDVLLLDLNLPDSRGLETLYKVKQHCPQIPIVIVTGSDDDDIAIQALKAGAQDYLVKGDLDIRIMSRCILYAIERTKVMSQREDFFAAILHDVKNPLIGSDVIFSSMLDERFGPLHPELQQITAALKESNRTVLQLLKNLLEIYRYDQDGMDLKFEPVDLGQIVNTTVAALRPLASVKGLNLEIEVGNTQTVNADSLALQRVFLNLIGNSIKYAPSGGFVSVRLAGEESAEVGITDNGEGISDEMQKQLFQRFHSGLEHDDTGCGLGLFFCKQIIESHQGSIQCQSKVGSGTTFTVELPRKK